jgi:hypothetical protein
MNLILITAPQETYAITLYYNNGLKRVAAKDIQAELKQHGTFDVLLAFNDPRTQEFTEGHVTFYPKEQITTTGRRFLGEHNYFKLAIPSDWTQNLRFSVGSSR